MVKIEINDILEGRNENSISDYGGRNWFKIWRRH